MVKFGEAFSRSFKSFRFKQSFWIVCFKLSFLNNFTAYIFWKYSSKKLRNSESSAKNEKF